MKTSGIDFELDYAHRLYGGDFSARTVANYALEYSNSTAAAPIGPTFIGGYGLPTGLGVPQWTITMSQSYAHRLSDTSALGVSLVERLIAPGEINPNYTAAQFPEGENFVPEITYIDATLSYKFQALGGHNELYATVQNLFDADPPTSPTATTFQQSSDFDLYDVLGRRFTIGLRAKW